MLTNLTERISYINYMCTINFTQYNSVVVEKMVVFETDGRKEKVIFQNPRGDTNSEY